MAIAVEELKTEASADVDAQELRRVLENAVLFTGKDTMRPVLCTVLVEVTEGSITTTATDSYTLGHDETPAKVSGFGRFMLDRGDVATVLKALKGQKYGDVRISTSTDSGHTSIIVEGAGYRYAFGAIEGQFPNWQQLIPAEGTACDDVIGLKCENLARFAKVGGGKDTVLKFSFKGGLKPVRIDTGSFVGLIMPVRI